MSRYFVFWKGYVKTTQDVTISDLRPWDLRSHIGWANATPQSYIDTELEPLWLWVVYISQVPLYAVTLCPCFLFPWSVLWVRCWWIYDPHLSKQYYTMYLQELTACVNCKSDFSFRSSRYISPVARVECHCQAGHMEPCCKAIMNISMF